MKGFGVKSSLAASALAAVGASVCCVGPLLLLGLGVGGAWVSGLTAFEPVRPVLIVLTLVFLGLAHRRLHRAPACEPGQVCAEPRVMARQRLIFWFVVVALLTLLAVPLAAPLLL